MKLFKIASNKYTNIIKTYYTINITQMYVLLANIG